MEPILKPHRNAATLGLVVTQVLYIQSPQTMHIAIGIDRNRLARKAEYYLRVVAGLQVTHSKTLCSLQAHKFN